MSITKKKTNKHNRTRKKVTTIARIEQNSFPTGKQTPRIQIAELYDKSELVQTTGKKQLDNKGNFQIQDLY